jgi:hypothetical protein
VRVPLFLWLAEDQSLWWRADKQERWSDLASVPLMAWAQSLWWRARQVRALLWPLFSRSAWAQPDTVVTDMSCEGDDLASVRSVGEVSASHCGDGQGR